MLRRLPKIIPSVLLFSFLGIPGCMFSVPLKEIKLGAELLKKSTLIDVGLLSDVETLEFLPTKDRTERLIAVFLASSVLMVDLQTGDVRRTIQFEDGVIHPTFVDVDQDSDPEILMRYGGVINTSFLDSTGKTVWQRPSRAMMNAAAGDLDGDGHPEIYLAGTSGLERVTPGGQTVCQAAPDTWFTTLLPYVHGDAEQPMLVARTLHGIIQLYNSECELMRTVSMAKSGLLLEIVRWPVGDRRARLITWHMERSPAYIGPTQHSIVVMDLNGQIEFEYTFPKGQQTCMSLRCAIVRFDDDEPPYLAVLGSFKAGTRRSMLSLFSLDGRLVYNEILGRGEGLLAVRPSSENARGEILLVSDGFKVVRYSLR